jgi:hypothetical protein
LSLREENKLHDEATSEEPRAPHNKETKVQDQQSFLTAETMLERKEEPHTTTTQSKT